MVVHILRVYGALQGRLRLCTCVQSYCPAYLGCDLINIVNIIRWTAQWGSPRQFLSGSWLCCWFPPHWCWSRSGPQSGLHRPHEPPVPHGDAPAPVDFNHHLAVGLGLEDDTRLVPLGRVGSCPVLDGYRCSDLKIIKVLGPVAPPLVVHLPLVGQGPLPVLLTDGPVLGGLYL